MMSSALLRPTAGLAQQPATIAAQDSAENVLGPPPVYVTASATTVCLGDSVLLTALQDRNFRWYFRWAGAGLPANVNDPNHSYWRVLVAPTQTTTYTVTGLYGASRSVTINVTRNCCEKQQLPPATKVITIGPGTYTAQTNPFTATHISDVYNVKGDITLMLGTFAINNKVLMAPGASIFLTEGADLLLDGGSAVITSACDEMWGGIYVGAFSRGIRASNGPFWVGLLYGTSTYGQMTYQHLNNSIRHSRNGVVLDQHYKNYLRLRGVNFQHCLKGVTFDCSSGPAAPTDFVRGCTFDSDPELMKKPFDNQGTGTAYYSEAHLSLGGDVSQARLTQNVFNHALFGVRSHEQKGVQAALTRSTFRDCYLAGMHLTNANGETASARVDSNRVFFPAALPATRQVEEAISDGSLATGQAETFGLLALKTPVVATLNRFVRPDSTGMDLYDFPKQGFSPQTGIYADQLTSATSNYFRLLHAGISLLAEQQPVLEGNTMLNCDRAIELGDRQGSWAGIVANNSCNTFARFDGKLRKGNTYGFYALPNASVTLQSGLFISPTQRGPIKNRFALDQSGIAGQHFSIYNDPANAFSNISYDTYKDGTFGNIRSDVQNASVGNVSVTANTNIPYIPAGQGNSNGCATDGYPNTGLQRPALVVGRKLAGSMNPAVPNPVADETLIGYVLPTSTRQAELLVRAGLDGKEVRKISLAIGEQEGRLLVNDLPNGLYFCTLLADGLPVQTQRLLVAH